MLVCSNPTPTLDEMDSEPVAGCGCWEEDDEARREDDSRLKGVEVDEDALGELEPVDSIDEREEADVREPLTVPEEVEGVLGTTVQWPLVAVPLPRAELELGRGEEVCSERPDKLPLQLEVDNMVPDDARMLALLLLPLVLLFCAATPATSRTNSRTARKRCVAGIVISRGEVEEERQRCEE